MTNTSYDNPRYRAVCSDSDCDQRIEFGQPGYLSLELNAVRYFTDEGWTGNQNSMKCPECSRK